MVELNKTFSINDVAIDRNVEDKDFAIVEIWALSEGNNTHHNPFSREVLERDAHTFKGKFIIGRYDKWIEDVKAHEVQEDIYGYVSVTDEPQFKTKIVEGIEKEFVVVKAYISKIYAKEIVDMFKIDNYRSVSCEFSCALQYNEDEYGRPIIDGVPRDEDNPVLGYSISGITILGRKINPSVKGADIVMKRFSEDTNKLNETKSKGEIMEENKNLSEQPKDEDIVMVEPNQQEIDDTENAKGDSKVDEVEGEPKEEKVELAETKEDETQEKEMSCGDSKEMEEQSEETKEEQPKEMSESEKKFAIDLDGLWCKIYDILESKYPNEETEYPESIYRIYGIYEEDGQKFVVLKKRADDTTYKANIVIEDEKIILSDELVEIKIETRFVPIEQVREFADEEHKEFVEKLFSCELKDMVEQVIELKKFMEATVKANTEKRFAEIMVEPKLCLGEKAYNVLFKEGSNLSLEELDSFEAKVKAFCEDAPKKQENTNDELLRFSCDDTNVNINAELSVDDLIKKYN